MRETSCARGSKASADGAYRAAHTAAVTSQGRWRRCAGSGSGPCSSSSCSVRPIAIDAALLPPSAAVVMFHAVRMADKTPLVTAVPSTDSAIPAAST
jgi:hypothetical protein